MKIAEIREELIQTGSLEDVNAKKFKNVKSQRNIWLAMVKPLFSLDENNLQNEELTFKIARKEELWFHAKDIPGSHVVISGNLNPSDEVKTDAAELAAYYSKGRLSNLVQVDMIKVKKTQ